MLLLTLRGTPTMYYGDEIGLARVAVSARRVQDPWEKNEPGLGLDATPRAPRCNGTAAQRGIYGGARPWLPLDLTTAHTM